MRQLAKSALSLGWALSLLGAKEAYNWVTGIQDNNEDVLNPVTRAAVNQLDESMRGIHRTAERMENRAVDMALSWFNPSRWAKGPGSARTDRAQRVVDKSPETAEET